MSIQISKNQARDFMLYKNGLIGPYKYKGKSGIMEFIRDVCPIQYDPVDVCGKSPEITLNARVHGFRKQMLYDLLYDERKLFDYYDKQMCILLMEDWKYFQRTRSYYANHGRSQADISNLLDDVRRLIGDKGEICSKDMENREKIDWYWAKTSVSRVALESLYLQGELMVSRKKNAVKYYDFAHRLVPHNIFRQCEPFLEDMDHIKWRIKRRIGAMGLLWNKASDALMSIIGLNGENRKAAFGALYRDGEILEISVEGIDVPMYMLEQDRPVLEYVLNEKRLKPRLELIAPLDNIIWDRKLVEDLFGFRYRWEIYTPEAKRQYGYYVLPVLYGNRFIGRIELIRDTKAGILIQKNFWPEEKVKISKGTFEKLEQAVERLAKMNEVSYERQTI